MRLVERLIAYIKKLKFLSYYWCFFCVRTVQCNNNVKFKTWLSSLTISQISVQVRDSIAAMARNLSMISTFIA
jgi:hypothetical protein